MEVGCYVPLLPSRTQAELEKQQHKIFIWITWILHYVNCILLSCSLPTLQASYTSFNSSVLSTVRLYIHTVSPHLQITTILNHPDLPIPYLHRKECSQKRGKTTKLSPTRCTNPDSKAGLQYNSKTVKTKQQVDLLTGLKSILSGVLTLDMCLHILINHGSNPKWSKSLCAPHDYNTKLQVMFKASTASLQTFIDTQNCVLEDRIQYSTVHIPNVL
jgi:hypothetical protein